MMTLTPDEIKMLMANHKSYTYSLDEFMRDALVLIQQLQAENAQQARCIENMTDKLNAMNDEVAKLQAERDAAAEVIKELAWDCDDGCKKYCKHYISDCGKGICPAYIEGVGDDEGKYPDFRWTCQDFTVCPREEGTPCEGCIGHHYANFEWRGVTKEDGNASD